MSQGLLRSFNDKTEYQTFVTYSGKEVFIIQTWDFLSNVAGFWSRVIVSRMALVPGL